MDRDGHETFEEMVGPIDSALERLWLKTAGYASRRLGGLKSLAAKRLPRLWIACVGVVTDRARQATGHDCQPHQR